MDDEPDTGASPALGGAPDIDGVPEVVVITGGHDAHAGIVEHVSPAATIIAADSGWDVARRLGLTPHLVVGDLDSISPAGLAAARNAATTIEEHPVDKDFTDAELALHRAALIPATRLTFVAGGDRLDHLLGALSTLADPRWDGVDVRGFVGSSRFHRVGPGSGVTMRTAVGATVSILAIGGPADGVTTEGLRWPLSGERLEPWRSRGVSNVAEGASVRVSVASGTVFVIEPDLLGPPARETAEPAP